MSRAARGECGTSSAALVVGLALLASQGAAAARAASPGQAAAAEDADRKKLDRLAEPWPDADKLAKRQAAAESLPLFRTAEPLAFSLAADFKAVTRDRKLNSPNSYPGVLTVAGESGQPVAIPVQINTRGKLRLNPKVCSFPPLKIAFSKPHAKGTPFEKQGSLKLVAHCRDTPGYEQHVLGESLAYKIANLLTPASFRIRLAKATYVDAVKGKELTTRSAFFIEDQDDVADRLQGRIAPLEKQLFRDLDQPSLLRLAVFQFMIGNTDYSIHVLHNVRLVQDRLGVRRPIAYDFDGSGLVDPPYAGPDKQLPIFSVRERFYRGPCVTLEQLEPTLAEFRARQAPILALYDAEAGLTDKQRDAAKGYLGDFFEILASPKRAKTFFVDRCRPAAGM